jgi:hypothetical protein
LSVGADCAIAGAAMALAAKPVPPATKNFRRFIEAPPVWFLPGSGFAAHKLVIAIIHDRAPSPSLIPRAGADRTTAR